MNLTRFIDDKLVLRKTIRILIYPNITFLKDLRKDSYIQVVTNMITELNKIRSDLFFYMILPQYMDCLDFPNVKQLYMKFPSYPPTMRSHFDVFAFKKLVGHDYDFDLVFSHLPEHTSDIKNVVSNITHHSPAYFGYCHWFDLHDIVTWSHSSFNKNILGILEMNLCYVNTQAQKKMVIKQASEVFNPVVVSDLEDIIKVQHLGVKKRDIDKTVVPYEKIIVFNHRPETYKDYKNFIEIVKELRKTRKDFKVWVPLLDQKPREKWIITDKFNKKGYYEKLRQCCVGFSPKQKYGGWSVSTTDGLMNGCPFIMYDADYYHELNPTADFFTSNKEAIALLDKYLDDPSYRAKKSVESLEHVERHLLYEDEIDFMSDYINQLVDTLHQTKSEVTDKLVHLIKENTSMTKKELFGEHLGWGRGIKFGAYRRALLNHPNIYDTMNPEPEYCWKNNERN